MNIDPIIVKFVTWLVAFLFTALIGILIWLSKSVITKINLIVDNQEEDTVERTSMKKDIDTIISDLGSIKSELKDIPDIKEKLIRIETNEVHMVKDMSLFKQVSLESQKKLLELSEKIIRQEHIITILENKK